MKILRFFLMACIATFPLSSCILGEDLGLFVLAKFNNNSDDTLLVFDSEFYPDTIFPYYDERQLRAEFYIVPPHSISDLNSPVSRKYFYERTYALQLFVYNYSVVRLMDASDLRKNEYLLRRYELTKEWMEEHDWTVTYP